MAAGEQLGVLATVGERLDRALQRVRRGVVELGGDHALAPPSGLAPFASAIASQIRIGLSGMFM